MKAVICMSACAYERRGVQAKAVFAALLDEERPSLYFRGLRAEGKLEASLPALAACIGVPQNPVYHPEGDVFEHTMLVSDCAAALRSQALHPLGFMLSALLHDAGKAVCTECRPDGKITSYQHEKLGLPVVEAQLRLLTDSEALVGYVLNMTLMHMRPNMLAACRSKRKKTRQLFDMSVCPEDLILLSRADASGKLDAPYDETCEAFLRERLDDYRAMLQRPMVTREDLVAAGIRPGEALEALLARARQLHFSGLERRRALEQVLAEAAKSLKNDIINSKK